ncbi:MAG: cytochrome P450 [Pseudomonadota bacterium]
MIPPKPPTRSDRAGFVQRLRLARRNLLAAQPDRLFDAMMAEMRTPVSHSVLVNDPTLVGTVLQSPAARFPKPAMLAQILRDLLGRSVFVTNGARWTRARALIDPAFSGGRLVDSLPAMHAAGRDALARLGRGGVIEAEAVTGRLAADVIVRAMFSRPVTTVEADTLLAAFRRYAQSAPLLAPAALMRAPAWLPRPLRRGRNAARAVRQVLDGLVAERAAALVEGTAPDDLASRLMTRQGLGCSALPEGFTADELADQMAIFLLAGHETSAAALAWALWLLATHPETQAALAREAAILPDTPDLAAIRSLSLTRAAVQETLRLYPPVPMLLRETAHPETWRGRRLPRGTLVILSPWHLHRHRRFWTEPDAFHPERWRTAPAPAAYIPFSAGPRICPGAGFAMMEVTLLLAMLVGRFHIAPAGPPPCPTAQLTLRAENGIPLRLTPR